MPANTKIEKFSPRELLNLRNELLQSGIDTWQAAEVLSGFLTGRGYGVSSEHARSAITRLEGMGCNLDCMQARTGKSGLCYVTCRKSQPCALLRLPSSPACCPIIKSSQPCLSRHEGCMVTDGG